MYYIINIEPTRSNSSKLQSTRTNSCQSHSLQNNPPIYFLSSPPRPCTPFPISSRYVLCLYLPACWLCAWMAVGTNDCRYRVALLRGILNLWLLSTCPFSNSGLSGCVSSVKNSADYLSPIDDKLCLCFLAFSPPPCLPSWTSCCCGVAVLLLILSLVVCLWLLKWACECEASFVRMI